MLLAVDVGNTNLTFGVFDGEELKSRFTMTTKVQARTVFQRSCVVPVLHHAPRYHLCVVYR